MALGYKVGLPGGIVGPGVKQPFTSDFLDWLASQQGATAGGSASVSQQGGTDSAGAAAPSAPTMPTLSLQEAMQQILNDPTYVQTMKTIKAQGIADAGNRDQTIRQTLIRLGVVPDFGKYGGDPTGFASADADATTRALAQKNTDQGLSLWARLNQQNDDNIRSIKNNLAARGITRSGATGFELGRQALTYKQGQNDAQQNAMDLITGAIRSFQNNEFQRQIAEAQAAAAAANEAAAYWAATHQGGGSTTPPPDTSGSGVPAPNPNPGQSYGVALPGGIVGLPGGTITFG